MLSLTGKRWLLPSHTDAINASHVLARLLAERGIDPNAAPLLPPSSVFRDMDRAVQRIQHAISSGQRVGIFGDYDCDGVTATAQLVRYFRRHAVEPWIRLPHRVHDGYGLSHEIVSEVLDAKVQLLITADTGIASVQEIAALQEHGVDVIVTDHHHVHEELPPCHSIIHPHFSNYPEPHPSGSGVAFFLVHALQGASWPSMEEDLALTMFGTIADLVALRGANRSLTQLGLAALERIETGPIATLRERCRSHDTPFTAKDIAFRLAPRINAAGRMEEADIALNALLTGGDLLARLDMLNEERQLLSRSLYEEVVRTLNTEDLPPLLTAVSGDYPHGIVGLIAGKLTEHYGRPSLVAYTDGRTCTASLRSPTSYNIIEGLTRCSSLLLGYGGHAQAAGCTFSIKHLDALCSALNEDITQHVDPTLLVPTLSIDAVLDPCDITLTCAKHLRALEPFGQENPEPLFLLQNCTLHDVRPCGSQGSHVQLRIGDTKAIGFGLAHCIDPHQQSDIVARIGTNTWKGRETVQLFIEDLALSTKKAPIQALS